MLNQQISGAASDDDALALIIDHFQADSGTIHLPRRRRSPASRRGERRHAGAGAVGHPHIPVGKGMAGLAVERREPVNSCNIQSDATGDVRPGARATALAGAIVVPIFMDEAVVGALALPIGASAHLPMRKWPACCATRAHSPTEGRRAAVATVSRQIATTGCGEVCERSCRSQPQQEFPMRSTLAMISVLFAATAANADCTSEVNDAFAKLRKSSAFRMQTTITNPQGTLTMSNDYVLPDRIHQTVSMSSGGPGHHADDPRRRKSLEQSGRKPGGPRCRRSSPRRSPSR